jgi:hypothetical protein
MLLLMMRLQWMALLLLLLLLTEAALQRWPQWGRQAQTYDAAVAAVAAEAAALAALRRLVQSISLPRQEQEHGQGQRRGQGQGQGQREQPGPGPGLLAPLPRLLLSDLCAPAELTAMQQAHCLPRLLVLPLLTLRARSVRRPLRSALPGCCWRSYRSSCPAPAPSLALVFR